MIKSWFNYRKADPGGCKSSPLDDLHPASWPPAWTTEFTDLLTVLTRLVALELPQETLLEEVVGGPLLTLADLVAEGTRIPKGTRDRRPSRPLHGPGAGTLDLGAVGEP